MVQPTLPGYNITVPAQGTFNDATAASLGIDDQAALWLHYTSASTPTLSTDVYHNARRVIDMWNQPVMWMLVRFLIPSASDWPAIDSGMGTILNLHPIAGDQITPDGSGIGWGYGDPVSPFHFAVGGNSMPALQPFVHLEETNDPAAGGPYQGTLPMVQPGNVYTALIRLQFGRNDFGPSDSMPVAQRRPGELDVWASADPSQPLTQVIQERNANTLIRAQRPSDGAWIDERYVDGWDGGPYIIQSTRANGGDKVWRHTQWATQWGETLSQCLADQPVLLGGPNDQRSVHDPGFFPDLGDAHADAVAITPPAVLLPSDLGGGSVTVSTPALGAAPSQSTPAPTPAPAATSAPSRTPLGLSGTDVHIFKGSGSTTGPGCSNTCSVSTGHGSVQVHVPGGTDGADSAYAVTDLGGLGDQTGRVYVRDLLGLGAGQHLTANLAVLEMRDESASQVYELYVAGDGTLRLWSPAGGLGANEINQSTGVVVPNNGSTIRVEVSAHANDSVVVRVDGVDRITKTHLTGATTGSQRYLEAGIDHYDSVLATDPVTVNHSALGASSQVWLGDPGADLVIAASPTSSTPTSPVANGTRATSAQVSSRAISPTPAPTSAAGTAPTPADHTPVSYSGQRTASRAFVANAARNGGFEANPSASWVTAGTGTLSWASDYAHTGKRSLKLTSKSEGLVRLLTPAKTIPATPGATYRVAIYMRTSSVRNSAGLGVNFSNRAAKQLPATVDSKLLRGTHGWTKLTLSATAPRGAASLRLQFRLAGPGTIWVDDVSAVRV